MVRGGGGRRAYGAVRWRVGAGKGAVAEMVEVGGLRNLLCR